MMQYKTGFAIFLFFCIVAFPADGIPQCPEGKKPFFTRPAQLEKFKEKYPNCDNYDFEFYYENGVLMDRPKPNLPGYLASIVLIITLLMLGLHFIFKKLKLS